MHDRLSIVSAERIRDELDKLIVVDHPAAGLWFLVDTGLAERVPARAAGHAPRAGSDPPPQGRADATRSPSSRTSAATPIPAEFDFRRTRLAALFHDVGKPKTRGYREGKGVTFHHHEVVGARMTRDRLQALRYSNDDVDAITELVALHLRFHTYRWAGPTRRCAATSRDAGDLLAELNVLTRCDCTTRNESKARCSPGGWTTSRRASSSWRPRRS